MKHADIFSGIGGWLMAAQWVGWQTEFNCEINPFARKVLKYYYPDAIQYEDITKTDFSVHRGGIDVLTGSWPCQPFSLAGKQKGKDDQRYLWPELLRAIREIGPRWFVGENVPGLINGNGGMEFEQVCSDLEAEGYEVTPFIIPAAGVGAPHQRERLWIVAFKASSGITSNPSSKQLQGSKLSGGSKEKKQIQAKSRQPVRSVCYTWEQFPTQQPIRLRDDGISSLLHTIPFYKWNKESIIAAGNSIVPQIAIQIFKTINEYERRIKEMDTPI